MKEIYVYKNAGRHRRSDDNRVDRARSQGETRPRLAYYHGERGKNSFSLCFCYCAQARKSKGKKNREYQPMYGYLRRIYFPFSSPVVIHTRSLVVFMTCICYCLAMLKVQKRLGARGRERMQTARGPSVTTNCACVSRLTTIRKGRRLRSVIVA